MGLSINVELILHEAFEIFQLQKNVKKRKTNPHEYSFGFNNSYDYLLLWSCGYLYISTLTKIQYIYLYNDIKHTTEK